MGLEWDVGYYEEARCALGAISQMSLDLTEYRLLACPVGMRQRAHLCEEILNVGLVIVPDDSRRTLHVKGQPSCQVPNFLGLCCGQFTVVS